MASVVFVSLKLRDKNAIPCLKHKKILYLCVKFCMQLVALQKENKRMQIDKVVSF